MIIRRESFGSTVDKHYGVTGYYRTLTRFPAFLSVTGRGRAPKPGLNGAPLTPSEWRAGSEALGRQDCPVQYAFAQPSLAPVAQTIQVVRFAISDHLPEQVRRVPTMASQEEMDAISGTCSLALAQGSKLTYTRDHVGEFTSRFIRWRYH
jgi:hypothetical protein